MAITVDHDAIHLERTRALNGVAVPSRPATRLELSERFAAEAAGVAFGDGGQDLVGRAPLLDALLGRADQLRAAVVRVRAAFDVAISLNRACPGRRR